METFVLLDLEVKEEARREAVGGRKAGWGGIFRLVRYEGEYG